MKRALPLFERLRATVPQSHTAARARLGTRAGESAAPGNDSRRDGALIIATGVVMLGLFLLVRTSLIDDAYITLSYAKNLALDLHWGVIPGEVSNTATSPLNVLLLAALTALARIGGEADAVLATGILSVAAAMAFAWAWLRVVRALALPFASAVVGIALVIGNPFLLSALGLEVLLVAAVVMVMLAMAVEQRPHYCECAIVDVFSDRGEAVDVINARIRESGLLPRPAYELNYLWLDRDQRRRPADYRLVYQAVPAEGPDVWQVWSPWIGTGHIRLEPAP